MISQMLFHVTISLKKLPEAMTKLPEAMTKLPEAMTLRCHIKLSHDK